MIDIIYQLQIQNDQLTEQNKALENALEDKRLRISNTGNLAEAALEINDCFRNAQNAADQYLNEIKIMHAEAQEQRQNIIAAAWAEANQIIADAKSMREYSDSVADVE